MRFRLKNLHFSLFNSVKMSSFADRASSITQHAMVGLAMSLAADTGMFQALADADEPLTSHQVAQATGLKERYVREILNSVAVAELVQMKETEDKQLVYTIEDKEGAKQALKTPLTSFMCFPGLLATIYPSLRECVPSTGPYCVRYSDKVQDWLDSYNGKAVPSLIKSMLTLVPGLKERLEKGIKVVEFGAGRGRLSASLAEKFPNSQFVATEYSEKLVASTAKTWAHIPNLTHAALDLCAVPESPENTYDWAFCNDVIHDLPHPLEALKGIQRLLNKPDGIFTFLDIATSGDPVADKGNMMVACYYAAGTFLCIPESYQQEDSVALGPCWGRSTAVKMAKEAGFVDVTDEKIESYHHIFICRLPQSS